MFLGKPFVPAPILVRLRGLLPQFAKSVHVSIEWLPRGRRDSSYACVSNNMLLVPWMEGAERARVSITAGTQTAELEIVARQNQGEVVDVRMLDLASVNAA